MKKNFKDTLKVIGKILFKILKAILYIIIILTFILVTILIIRVYLWIASFVYLIAELFIKMTKIPILYELTEVHIFGIPSIIILFSLLVLLCAIIGLIFKDDIEINFGKNSLKTSTSNSSQLHENSHFSSGFYDGAGNWRTWDQSYQDASGTWRNPGDSFIDGKGTLRNPGDDWQDSDGNYYSPGQPFKDGKGNWRS